MATSPPGSSHVQSLMTQLSVKSSSTHSHHRSLSVESSPQRSRQESPRWRGQCLCPLLQEGQDEGLCFQLVPPVPPQYHAIPRQRPTLGSRQPVSPARSPALPFSSLADGRSWPTRSPHCQPVDATQEECTSPVVKREMVAKENAPALTERDANVSPCGHPLMASHSVRQQLNTLLHHGRSQQAKAAVSHCKRRLDFNHNPLLAAGPPTVFSHENKTQAECNLSRCPKFIPHLTSCTAHVSAHSSTTQTLSHTVPTLTHTAPTLSHTISELSHIAATLSHTPPTFHKEFPNARLPSPMLDGPLSPQQRREQSDPDEDGEAGTSGAEPAVSVARRNERERNRVKLINMTFATLRQHLPQSVRGDVVGDDSVRGDSEAADLALCRRSQGKAAKLKKMSKVETLRAAIDYIKQLHSLIRERQHSSPASASPAHHHMAASPAHHHRAVRESARSSDVDLTQRRPQRVQPREPRQLKEDGDCVRRNSCGILLPSLAMVLSPGYSARAEVVSQIGSEEEGSVFEHLSAEDEDLLKLASNWF